MSEASIKEIGLSIPAMQWQTWETLVKLALERSEGVTEFKLKIASANVKFDTEKITEETIVENVKKATRYDLVTVIEPLPMCPVDIDD